MTPDKATAVLRLNGFPLAFDRTEFEVFERTRGADFDLRSEREAKAADWKLFVDRGQILTIRRTADAPLPPGIAANRDVAKSLPLVKWLVAEALPDRFPAYPAMKRHPFMFAGTQRDLMAEVATEMGKAAAQLTGFTIRPKYKLETRIVSLRGRDAFVGLFVAVSTKWDVNCELGELVEAGVDLRGLYIVRREVQPGERRLVGRVDRLEGDTVVLSDAFEGLSDFQAGDAKLEGTRQSFARCLQVLLADQYDRFDGLRSRHAAGWLQPAAVDAEVDRIGEFVNRQPLVLSDGLEAHVCDRLELPKRGHPPNVTTVSPVRYCFDAARSKQDRAAWSGLTRYGPFSQDTFPKKSPRILVVFPDLLKGRVETFLKALLDGAAGAQATGYNAGLASTFGLVHPELTTVPIPWAGSARPHDRYRTAIEDQLAEPAEKFDAAIVVIRDEDARLPDAENPYLHSKALLLVTGIPSQEVRQSTIGDARGLPWTLRNISIALYAKLGGTPWTVNQDMTISDEVIVGVGLCELGESRFAERQRYVGVTTVFRGDGNYLLGNLSKECSFDEYPEILRTSTTQVLESIKQRNAWQPGATVRVVCHALRPMRNIDTARIMADCVATVGDKQTIEFAFLTVSRDHPFRLTDPKEEGTRRGRGKLVPERGTVVNLGSRARLLTVTGPSLLKTDLAPLPYPLLVKLHHASSFRDLDYLTEQVLKLTALSWRSVLPGSQPVTILYSELIAELLGRLRAVSDWSPATLNTSLRSSRWFL